MLLDENSNTLRIVSVDPGTNSLGVAVLDLDIFNNSIVVQHAFTIDIQKHSARYSQINLIHGERVAKLHAVRQALYRFYCTWQPDHIVSEAPYMGRFPQAYAALVECVSSIRYAVMEYHQAKPLNTIDPATVKKTVGVSGKSGDKSLMTKAIAKLENTVFNVTLDSLDEHAIDAIAVGYAFCKTLIARNDCG